MATDRRIVATALAVALAAPAEGLRRTWYYDPPGIPTVCYGHTGADVDKHKVYSIAECKSLMNTDMLEAVDKVESCHPGLPPRVLAAFASAAYNIGPVVACGPGSTASRLLGTGRIADACNELPKWDKAHVAGQLVALPGLTKRRLQERDLCLAPSAEATTTH